MTDANNVYTTLDCEYCPAGIHVSVSTFKDCTFIDHEAVDAERDPECAICIAPFESDEELIRHDPCRRVFHKLCVDTQVRFERTTYDASGRRDDYDVRCGNCRGPIATIAAGPEFPRGKVTIADDSTHDRLMYLLRNNNDFRVFNYPRGQIEDLINRMGHRYPNSVEFFQRFLRHGSVDTFQLPQQSDRPGRLLFRAARSIEAGALRAKHCPHWTETILARARTMYDIQLSLFENGWNQDRQYGGVLLPGLYQHRLSLHQLIQWVDGLGRMSVEISAAQFRWLFRSSSARIRDDGWDVLIRVLRTAPGPARDQLRIRFAVYRFDVMETPQDQILSPADAQEFMRTQCGGWGSYAPYAEPLRAHPHDTARECRHHDMSHLALSTRSLPPS